MKTCLDTDDRPAKWEQFHSEGYRGPVTGIRYSDPGTVRPPSGMPLGGISTGGIAVEPCGSFGYSSIFNHLTPLGGPLNTPFLGMAVGKEVWVLSTGRTKPYDTGRRAAVNTPDLRDPEGWKTLERRVQAPASGRDHIEKPGKDLPLDGVKKAGAVEYWGHYPVADLNYRTSAPVEASLRAWSPFFPGDSKGSNTPAAVFEVTLRNTSEKEQSGALAFSFPGFNFHASRKTPCGDWVMDYARVEDAYPDPSVRIEEVRGATQGVLVADAARGMEFTVTAIEESEVRHGGPLGADGQAWSAISTDLPRWDAADGGVSIAVDFSLAPGASRKVRFLLSWFAPVWKGAGAPDAEGPEFHHMYAKRFSGAIDVAQFMARTHADQLKKIISWQEVLYDDADLPGWLADALINNLYHFTRNTIWAQKDSRFPFADESEGIFGVNEAPRSCSQMGTLPNCTVGNIPVALFFPDLDRSIIRQFAASLTADGDVAPILGYYTWEPGNPQSYGYQLIMNGANFMTLLDRHYVCTGDTDFVREFYDAAKRACRFSFSLRPDYSDTQLLAMQPEGIGKGHPWLDGSTLTEWFEDRVYHGYQIHAGCFRMAAAMMMRRWAQLTGDSSYATELTQMLEASKIAAEEHLWTGDHYRLYHEPETGRKMDVFFTPAFDGQLFAKEHGLGEVLPEERVRVNLDQFAERACTVSRFGIPPTYAPVERKDSIEKAGYLSGDYNYVNYAVYMLSMTCLYEDRREMGLKLLRRVLEMELCTHGYTWDGVHVASREADDGTIGYGSDYSMRMALWGVLGALQGKSFYDMCRGGGWVHRLKAAASSDESLEAVSSPL